MVVLIAGTTHTGKTKLAQKLLEKYKFSYLSIDHLKMGLIRSKNTTLTPNNDKELELFLWPILREMIKTVIENNQNIIIEGCYIPFNWSDDFETKYLKSIQYFCIIMSENYINKNFEKIKHYAHVIEKRLDDSDLNQKELIKDNTFNLKMCLKHKYKYILIEENYDLNVDLQL